MDTELKIILTSLKEMLKSKYGHDFSKLYIFGSQKDSFHPDSDCDVMIIFKKEKNWKEIKKIMNLVIDIGIENDIVFDSKIYSEVDLNKPIYKEIPLIKNILKTGVVI